MSGTTRARSTRAGSTPPGAPAGSGVAVVEPSAFEFRCRAVTEEFVIGRAEAPGDVVSLKGEVFQRGGLGAGAPERVCAATLTLRPQAAEGAQFRVVDAGGPEAALEIDVAMKPARLDRLRGALRLSAEISVAAMRDAPQSLSRLLAEEAAAAERNQEGEGRFHRLISVRFRASR